MPRLVFVVPALALALLVPMPAMATEVAPQAATSDSDSTSIPPCYLITADVKGYHPYLDVCLPKP